MRLRILIFILLNLCIYTESVISQSAKIDSLENLITKHKQIDTFKIDLLNKAAEALQNISPTRALKHLSDAKVLSEKLNYRKGKADYFNQLALYYYVSSEFDSVLKYTKKSLSINQLISNNKGIAKNYYYLGKIHYFKGDIDQAIDFLNQSLEINQELKDSSSICYAYASLGTNYADIGDYQSALKYEKEALKIAYQIQDEEAISFSLNNLGVVYEHHGNWPKALECYQKSFIIDERQRNYKDAAVAASNIANILKIQGNYSDALTYCHKGLAYSEKVGFKTGLCYNYEYMAHIYVAMGDYSKAMEYQEKTLALQKEIGNQQGVVIAYRDLGEIFLLQNEISSALQHYNTAIHISKSISYKRTEISSYIGIAKIHLTQNKFVNSYSYSKKAYNMARTLDDLKLICESAEILALSSARLGYFEEAFNAHSTYKIMSDSLFNEENIRRVSNLEYEYKAEKEKELAKQEQQKKDRIQEAELKRQKLYRNTFIFGFLLMILLAIGIWYGLVIKRKANEQLQKKNKEINKQAQKLAESNKSLKQLSQFKEDMTNMVIHDLKNPLSTMIHVDILSEEVNKDKLIKHLAYKMLNMIENTLDLYKHESVELILNKEQNNLISIINSAIEEVDFLAKFNQLRFNIILKNKILINSDAIVLRRIFVNILSNAVKFSRKNDVITINNDVINNTILNVEIHNNGSYINPEQQEHIFKKFGQLKSNSENKIHSTGIGLTYCAMAIESHNGTIGVESSQEYGTTFRFTIPEAEVV